MHARTETVSDRIVSGRGRKARPNNVTGGSRGSVGKRDCLPPVWGHRRSGVRGWGMRRWLKMRMGFVFSSESRYLGLRGRNWS